MFAVMFDTIGMTGLRERQAIGTHKETEPYTITGDNIAHIQLIPFRSL